MALPCFALISPHTQIDKLEVVSKSDFPDMKLIPNPVFPSLETFNSRSFLNKSPPFRLTKTGLSRWWTAGCAEVSACRGSSTEHRPHVRWMGMAIQVSYSCMVYFTENPIKMWMIFRGTWLFQNNLHMCFNKQTHIGWYLSNHTWRTFIDIHSINIRWA